MQRNRIKIQINSTSTHGYIAFMIDLNKLQIPGVKIISQINKRISSILNLAYSQHLTLNSLENKIEY